MVEPLDGGDLDYGDFDPNEYFPTGFLPEDASDDDIETLADIRDVIGRPFSDVVSTYERLANEGRAGQIRATNFASGMEAMLWLFRRGIFLYSDIVQFKDGSWGVAIGDSPKPGVDTPEDEPAF